MTRWLREFQGTGGVRKLRLTKLLAETYGRMKR